MLRNILFCAVVSLFVSAADGSSVGLRFLGKTYLSYAEYDAWNWNPNGTLQFYFKTSSHKKALIFYQDRNEDGDDVEAQFMDLFLLPGGARFRARVGNEEDNCSIYGNFRDSKWHRVNVAASDKHILFSIDNYFCKRIPDVKYPSSKFNGKLFIGGIPYIHGFQWSYPQIHYEVYGFQGCIGGLKYNRVPSGRPLEGRLQRSSQAEDNCTGACANQCYNGGQCIDNVVDFECDCLGTGYEGLYCTKASTIVYMNGKDGYISYKLRKDNPLWNTERNTIDFRFLPDGADGVIMYMGGEADHLLIELINGSLRVQANFGGGSVEVYVSDDLWSKNCWHFVQVRRRRTLLTVRVDRGRSGNASRIAHGNFTSLNLNNESDVIYFGGGPSEALVRSKAMKRHFSGFLQQFRFEQFQVLDEAKYRRNNFRMHNVKTTGYDNTILKDLQKLCASDSSAGSGCPPNDDDTDNCNQPPTPTIGTSTTASTPATKEPTTQRKTPKPSEVIPELSRNDPTPRPKGVSAWLVIVIVLSAVALVLVSVFLLYRWNHRYTGSFKPSKNEEGQLENPEAGSEHQRPRMYEQPAFFVYKAPKKPPNAQSPPVSI